MALIVTDALKFRESENDQFRRLSLSANFNTPVPVSQGGTGANNAADAITNLGIENVTDLDITATAGSGVTIRRFHFHRMGRIVFGELYFDVTSALSNNSVVVTMDRSLPRSYDLYATAVVRNISGSFGMVGIERGDSAIKAWGAIPVGTYNYAQFAYVAL